MCSHKCNSDVSWEMKCIFCVTNWSSISHQSPSTGHKGKTIDSTQFDAKPPNSPPRCYSFSLGKNVCAVSLSLPPSLPLFHDHVWQWERGSGTVRCPPTSLISGGDILWLLQLRLAPDVMCDLVLKGPCQGWGCSVEGSAPLTVHGSTHTSVRMITFPVQPGHL